MDEDIQERYIDEMDLGIKRRLKEDMIMADIDTEAIGMNWSLHCCSLD